MMAERFEFKRCRPDATSNESFIVIPVIMRGRDSRSTVVSCQSEVIERGIMTNNYPCNNWLNFWNIFHKCNGSMNNKRQIHVHIIVRDADSYITTGARKVQQDSPGNSEWCNTEHHFELKIVKHDFVKAVGTGNKEPEGTEMVFREIEVEQPPLPVLHNLFYRLLEDARFGRLKGTKRKEERHEEEKKGFWAYMK
ncbi:hypothetical protein RUM43_003032 [Polyplax serrata]|uniref:Uncharacterized protein n=1 Tax=Polyplax serrata TaxID=468196 RepID=A0AAN8P2V5_POLSC